MSITIAIDTMGGDNAPDVTIEGAYIATKTHPEIKYILFGNEKNIIKLVKSKGLMRNVENIYHSEQTVTSEMKPSLALRNARKSSMGLAINSVAKGKAGGVISAGNTGAYMALSKIVLKTIEGVDRPAIIAVMPVINGKMVMLDLGANIKCSTENLIQFALMGEIFAKHHLGIQSPKVGLLNVGVEDLKGHSTIRDSYQIIKENNILKNFIGFVEGNKILSGEVDVVVTDGFTGNVSLKTIEGTANLIKSYLRKSLTSSLFAKLGYLMLRNSFNQFKQKVDPRAYNGAMMIGLNGIAIKSHGSTDSMGFASAIKSAFNLINNNVNHQIKNELICFHKNINKTTNEYIAKAK